MSEKEDKAIREYLEYLEKQRMYSPHTVLAYQRDIEQFLNFLHQEDYSLFTCDTKVIRNFLEAERKRGISKVSLKRKIVSLRGFYHRMLQQECIHKNPFITISSPKTDKKLPDFLYSEEVFRLLDENKKRTDTFVDRDQAILELLFASGLRASELCSLLVTDFQWNRRMIKVNGKGKKDRYVFFTEAASKALEKYLHGLRYQLTLKRGSKPENHMFLNEYGNPLTIRGLEYILSEIEKKLGLGLSLHPHKFRHTFATMMLSNGADLRTIQELLGHESLSTTQIYTHITTKRMLEDYQKYFPRTKKK